MIAKISFGSNVDGMVRYNAEKENKKNDENIPLGQFLIADNILNTTTKGIINTIKNRNKRSDNIDKPNIHISLNFTKDESIDNDKIISIARDYMNLMNMSEQPYAVYRHYDRKHPHIHIVSTQIDLKGNKINDSFLFYKSRAHCRTLEKKHNLIEISNTKNTKNKTEFSESKGYVDHINISIKKVLEEKPTSIKQFDYFLKSYGIERKQLNENHFFEFDNIDVKDFEQINNVIYPNQLEQNYSIEYLKKITSVFSSEKKLKTKQVQAKIFSITNSITKPIPEDDLKTLFSKKGLSLEFDTIKVGEKKGQINKMFIKDLNSNIKFSASELNIRTKDFINSYLKLNSLEPKQKNLQFIGQNKHYDAPEEFAIKNDALDSLIFNLLQLGSANSEQQEDLRKKKKKRKKR